MGDDHGLLVDRHSIVENLVVIILVGRGEVILEVKKKCMKRVRLFHGLGGG